MLIRNRDRWIGNRDTGFTLIEVMVALCVLSVGLLGVVKLESAAYSSTNVASKRSMAALEAASLAGAMHVNRGYWTQADASGGTIVITGTAIAVNLNAPLLAGIIGTPQNCTSTSATLPCTPLIMAAYDLQQWALTLQGLLPNDTATINCGTSAPVSCMINITWSENEVALNNQETGALAGPSYTLYVEP